MIEKIESDKEKYLELLLIADPSEEMVMKYLGPGDLYVIHEKNAPVCAAVVYTEGETSEIKNISTYPGFQKQGYGKKLMEYLIDRYGKTGDLILGTSRTGIPGKEFYQLEFYLKCGFEITQIIENYFVDNYPEPIFEENGEQCVDMVYMKYKG